MEVIEGIAETRARLARYRAAGESVGLVPTMGALHEGHLALVDRAAAECDRVAVSIFVNPTQFAPGEDFEAYPRDLDADLATLRTRGVDLVFSPTAAAMYPDGVQTRVSVAPLGDMLIGAQRPGHFSGVATVVSKLFHIVEPARAYFGEKDYQQLTIIRRMVADLMIPVEVVGVPTVRARDGLALSSRNARLSAGEREAATVLSRALDRMQALIERGEDSREAVLSAGRAVVAGEARVALRSLDIRRADDLSETDRLDEAPIVVLITATVGDVFLIDQRVAALDRGRHIAEEAA